LYVLAQRRGRLSPAHPASPSARIEAGRVLVNTLAHEPAAPFGGFKQSGIGREYGTFGIEAFLEPNSLLGTMQI
jgi:aldehyde dehydrogenase (NAD+)